MAVAVIAILATAAMLFFSGKEAISGEVISIAVSEPKEGVQEVIIKFLPEGALEPVYIKAVCDGSKITVEIYGEKNPYEIVRESVIVKRGAVPSDKIIVDEEGKFVSEQMQSGERMRVRGALAGMTSEGYLYYYEQGRLVEKRAVRKDNYQPLQGIIAKKP